MPWRSKTVYYVITLPVYYLTTLYIASARLFARYHSSWAVITNIFANIFCLKINLRFFHEKIESEFRPNIIGSLESRAEFRLVSEIIWGNQVGWDFWNDLQVGFQEKNEGCPRGEGTSPLEKNVIDIIYHFIRDEMQITPININLFSEIFYCIMRINF